MVTDDGTKIALSRIGFLLASDQSDAFSIVCNDGEVIYQVASVSFAQGEPTGISSATTEAQQTLQLNVASSSLQAQRLSARHRHHDLRCERQDDASGGAAVRWYDLYCWPACWYLCPEGWFGKCEVLEEVTLYTENHDEKEISIDDSLYGGFLCGTVTVRNRADRW